VWTLITDWERQGDWMLEARDFVVTSAHRKGVGVEAEATVRIGGITTRDRVRVTGWDPPRRLSLQHVGWVTGTGDLILIPVGASETRVVWRGVPLRRGSDHWDGSDRPAGLVCSRSGRCCGGSSAEISASSPNWSRGLPDDRGGMSGLVIASSVAALAHVGWNAWPSPRRTSRSRWP
jgi:hypothetical protein